MRRAACGAGTFGGDRGRYGLGVTTGGDRDGTASASNGHRAWPLGATGEFLSARNGALGVTADRAAVSGASCIAVVRWFRAAAVATHAAADTERSAAATFDGRSARTPITDRRDATRTARSSQFGSSTGVATGVLAAQRAFGGAEWPIERKIGLRYTSGGSSSACGGTHVAARSATWIALGIATRFATWLASH